MRFATCTLVAFIFFYLTATSLSAQIMVSTLDDSGTGSLREAITTANGTGNVTITFEATGPGVINLITALPAITADGIVIDGQSQAGWDLDTDQLIELNGSALSSGEDGLDIQGESVEIYGLKITDFPNNGITGGSSAVNAKIGEFGRENVISGNGNDGINTAAGGWTITSNRIGTASDGSTADGNGRDGIRMTGSTASNVIDNLISGNTEHGIMRSGTTGDLIQGNFIGTDFIGDAALPNGGDGINATTVANLVIGGSNPGEGNLISGNIGNGINLNATGTPSVIGNIIGLGALEDVAIPNAQGIQLSTLSTALIDNNIIAGNTSNGIFLTFVSGSNITSNLIGLNNSFQEFGNGGNGIHFALTVASSGNTIFSNLIGNNLGFGALLDGTNHFGNIFTQNGFFSNDSGGISLQDGSNNGKAPPTIDGIFDPSIISGTGVDGDLIEVYYGDGSGQGDLYLDQAVVTSGTWSVSTSPLFGGEEIVATATNSSDGTSEFASITNPFRNALEFDGSNDYVVTSENTDLSGDVELSLSAWVNVNNLSSGQTVIHLGNAGTANAAFSMFINTDGSVSAQMAGSTFVTTNAGAVSAGQWYHLVITKSTGPVDTGVNIYVNGIAQTGLTSNSTVANNLQTGPIFLGSFGLSGSLLSGWLDEVVVWEKELSPAEVSQLANTGLTQNEDAIYTYYDIEGCSGSILPDLSGKNFHGTLTNFDFSTGSDWAYTESIVGSAPTDQAAGITITNLDETSFNISWENGSGKKKMVFLKQTASTEIATPTDGVTYLSALDFGAGDELSPNFHAVYDGYGTSTTVTGLEPVTDYRILIYEYNDCVGFQYYNTSVSEGENATNVQTAGVKRLSYAREFRVNEATLVNNLDLGSESILVPEGMTFSVDGTKLYVVGSSNNNITEFTLGTPFDVTTGTNTYVYNIDSEDAIARGIAINPAGTKLFMVGSSNDLVHQYQLSTPYDLSTLFYSGHSFDISNEDSDPQDIAFDPDGNNMFVSGANTGAVYRYTLSEPFDLNSASYSGTSLSVLGENGLVFTNDGSTLLVGDAINDEVYQYNLSTSFDISTGVLSDAVLSTGSTDGDLRGLAIDEQGTAFYLLGSSNDALFQYFLDQDAFNESPLDDGSAQGKMIITIQGDSFSNAGSTLTEGTDYTITNVPSGLTPSLNVLSSGRVAELTFTGSALSNGDVDDVTDLQLTFNGSAFLSGSSTGIDNANAYSTFLGINFLEDLKRLDYSVSQPISGVAFNQSYDLNPHSILIGTGLSFNEDGSMMFILGSSNNKLSAFDLSTPFDISTASFSVDFDVSLIDISSVGFDFSPAGTVLFLVGSGADQVYEVRLTEPYDLTTAYYTGVSLGLESGEGAPLDISFNADGFKFFVGGGNNGLIYEYNLSTPFDLSTAVFSGNSLSTIGQDGVVFNANGSELYVLSSTNDRVYQYHLSIPFDITSGVYSDISFAIAEDGDARAMAFNNSQTKLYLVGASNDDVFEYDLSSFAFSEGPDNEGKIEGSLTISITGDAFASSGLLTSGTDYSLTNVPAGLTPSITVATDLLSADLSFTGTATNNQNLDDVGDLQFTFFDAAFASGNATAIANTNASSNLGINFLDNDLKIDYSPDRNISTAAFVQSVDLSSIPINIGTGLHFSPDGTRMFISDSNGDQVVSFTLSTAFDISTASQTDVLDVSLVDVQPVGITFNQAGSVMLMLGSSNDQIYEFRLTEPFDLKSAAYSGLTLALESGEGAPQDINYNHSGSKLYVGGNNNGLIYEYDLSTNYDLSTAVFSGRSLSALAQDGIKFNAAGTKLFLVSSVQDRIYQYDLSIPYDVSSGVYNGVYLDILTEDGDGRAIAFSEDGTRLFLVGASNDNLYEYQLPAIAFNEAPSNDGSVLGQMIIRLEGDSFVNAGSSLTETTHYTIDNRPPGLTPDIFVDTDGSIATLTFSGFATNNQDADDLADLQLTFEDAAFTTNLASSITNAVGASSNLGISFDDNLLQITYASKEGITTAESNDSYDLSIISALNASAMTFGDAGNKAFITDQSADRIYELSLSVPYDISTATLTNDISIADEENNSTDLAFNDSGTRMFLIGTGSDQVIEFELLSAFDLSTAALTGESFSVDDSSPLGMTFAASGTKLYVAGSTTSSAYEYDLSVPYDISTAVFSGNSISVLGQEGVTMNADGTRLYFVSSATDLVYRYDLSTPYDLSTAIYSDVSLNVNDQDATPEDITIDPTGTKLYMVGTSNDRIFEYDLNAYAFQESTTNDGSVEGELIIRLDGDTFINAGGVLTETTHYTINNLPIGLIPNISVASDGSTASLVLTGSAINNQDADDLFDLQFTFEDAAFTDNLAIAVSNAVAASSSLGVNFDDNLLQLTYATKTDLATAKNSSSPFDLSGILALNVSGLVFSNDGLKAFVVDQTTDRVYELALGVPYDVSTASLTVDISIINEEENPTDIAFNDSGSRMFIVGSQNDRILTFELTTAFDLSTAAFTGEGFDVGDTFPQSMTFANAGLKLYVGGSSAQSVVEFDLSIPFDITTAVATGNSISSIFGPEGVEVNADGTRLFVLSTSDLIYQYDISVPYDLSTASYSGISLSTAAEDASPEDIAFNPEGTKLYLVGTSNDQIYEYDLNTNAFLETTTNDGSVQGELIIRLDGDAFINAAGTLTETTHYTINNMPAGLVPEIAVSSDGSAGTLTFTGSAANSQDADDLADLQFTFEDAAFITNSASSITNATSASSNLGINFDDNLVQLTYATKIDLATAKINDSYDLTAISAINVSGLKYNNDGTKAFLVDQSADRVYELALASPYDVSSATLTTDKSIANEEDNATDIAFNDSGSRMFVLGTQNDKILEFALATAFDLSTASFTGKGFDVGDSFPLAMTFAASGTKLYVGGSTAQAVYEYDLTIPYDISSASYSGNLISGITSPEGVEINADGTRLFVLSSSDDLIYQYDLPTPFDLSTNFYSGISLSTVSEDSSPEDITFDAEGTKLYMVGTSNDAVYEYDLNADVFQEAASNDGSVIGELVIELEGDSFINAGGALARNPR